MTLRDAFARRRTHRDFSETPVEADQLATVLSCAFAPQRFIDAELFGVQQLRASPSAGARHEVECYVAVLNVTGIPAGLYHYNALTHSLELLRDDIDRQAVGQLTYDQRQCLQGAFLCFTTVVAQRLAWKYRHPRAYRLWMLDAGHYGQTFALACTALGLGPFQTAAFRDSAVETALGIDGNEEFAAYLLGAGVPLADRSSGSLPPDYRYPLPTELA